MLRRAKEGDVDGVRTTSQTGGRVLGEFSYLGHREHETWFDMTTAAEAVIDVDVLLRGRWQRGPIWVGGRDGSILV